MKPALVDVDDLWNTAQIEKWLLPLAEEVPGFHVTCYTIPNRFGPVEREHRERFPFVTWGIHGFEHTFGECLEWSPDKASFLLDRALIMGYDKVFKPPQWCWDEELNQVFEERGMVLHLHKEANSAYPLLYQGRGGEAYIHTHIEENPSTDFIASHPLFTPESLRKHEVFLNPMDMLEEK